jgi:hypothetical protein
MKQICWKTWVLQERLGQDGNFNSKGKEANPEKATYCP